MKNTSGKLSWTGKYNRKLCLKKENNWKEYRKKKTTNYANKSSSLSDKLPGCGSNRLASSSLRTWKKNV